MKLEIVLAPPRGAQNSYHFSNRPPLLVSPSIGLPLGSVRPRGWLAGQIDLMKKGLTGRLEKVSPYLAPENGWLDPAGEGWEEVSYWLRGFYDMAVFASQDEDGFFGPRSLKAIRGNQGQIVCDLRPRMFMIAPIIRHFEHTGDIRVVPFLQRFFRFCADLPSDRFVLASTARELEGTLPQLLSPTPISAGYSPRWDVPRPAETTVRLRMRR